MSRYTGFAIKVTLSQKTPQSLLDILNLMVQGRSDDITPSDHPFFRQRRWDRILCGSSAHFEHWNESVLDVDQTGFILASASSTTGFPDGMKYFLLLIAPWIIPTDDRIAISQDEESYNGFNEYFIKDGLIRVDRCVHTDASVIREWEGIDTIMSAGQDKEPEYDGIGRSRDLVCSDGGCVMISDTQIMYVSIALSIVSIVSWITAAVYLY